MTPQEWADLGQHITARWPHQPPPMESLAAWYEDVKDLPAVQVRAAIAAMARDGREFPPTGGMLRRRVFELAVDAPTFGDAWSSILRAVAKFGHMRGAEALAWLAERHVLYPALARQVGWREICLSEAPDVIRGQARRIYEALVAQTTRELALRGLPDAGLTALERVNSSEYAALVEKTVAQMPALGSGK